MTPARQRHLPPAVLAGLLPVIAALGLACALAGPAEAGQISTAAANAKGAPAHAAGAGSTQSIVALVNDEPITGYEIEQRMRLALLSANELQRRMQSKLKSGNINDQFKAFAIARLKVNPPQTEAEQQARIKQLQGQFVESIRQQVEADYRPQARKEALDELIEERLKLQEAARLNVVAAQAEVDRVINGMAERNKMTAGQFAEHMAKMGANISTMRQRIKASLSWADVIRARFGHQIAIAGRDIDRMVATTAGEDEVELRVQRILLSAPADGGDNQVAQRLSDAERIRTQFSGCTGMGGLAASVPGARFDDLGDRKPASIPEPTRSMLMSSGDGEMLPPTLGESGVELWVVCSRKVVKAEQQKRQTAENDLRQKEFEILSRKHLKDLRQDAHIEYR